MNTISNEGLYEENHQIIVDVRSPSEYQDFHITGAVNVPLFSDEERHNIGLTYKQNSVLEAKKLGMKYMSKRLVDLTEILLNYAQEYKRVVLYCQRGGMRSQSITSLLNALMVDNICLLQGGIKGHRQYTSELIEKKLSEKEFIVLHGLTGVSKTKILVELDKKGLDVLDYEGLAQNAGSVFGNMLYSGDQPSQKQFEELVFNKILTSKSHYIFIESESKRVGNVLIPDIFMEKLSKGKHILIETRVEKRIENLLSDYIYKDEHDALIQCVERLRKRISNIKADELIEYIQQNTLEPLVEFLLVDYYDPLYNYSIKQYNYLLTINYIQIEEAVDKIIDLVKKGI